MEEWKEVTLGEVIVFNPKENLKKGILSKKVAMDNIQPFTKKIREFTITEFTSGTKFRNNDTLLARITPCLENGKTAKVDFLEKNEIAFGSTEYIVMREKEDVTDNDFIYYLARDTWFRDIAIKSMVGTSGRQRVQLDVIKKLKINLPPLKTQKQIAKVLSTIDDKIELNDKMNKNLEMQAQAIFKSWFVDFEPFQDGEFVESELGLIPKGWEVGKLGDYIKSIDNRGKTPPLSIDTTEYPIIDVKALGGIGRIIDYEKCIKYVDEDTYNTWFRSGHPEKYDILISTVGSIGEMKMFLNNKGCIAQNVVGFRCTNISPLYMFQYMLSIKNDLISYNIGSVQPSIKVTHIIKKDILKPDNDVISKYSNIVEDITEQILNNQQQIEKLKSLRDTLLPHLMSGEIDVSAVEVE